MLDSLVVFDVVILSNFQIFRIGTFPDNARGSSWWDSLYNLSKTIVATVHNNSEITTPCFIFQDWRSYLKQHLVIFTIRILPHHKIKKVNYWLKLIVKCQSYLFHAKIKNRQHIINYNIFSRTYEMVYFIFTTRKKIDKKFYLCNYFLNLYF